VVISTLNSRVFEFLPAATFRKSYVRLRNLLGEINDEPFRVVPTAATLELLLKVVYLRTRPLLFLVFRNVLAETRLQWNRTYNRYEPASIPGHACNENRFPNLYIGKKLHV